jgi:hypothetical protein
MSLDEMELSAPPEAEKAITLSREGRLYRWAYLFTRPEDRPPAGGVTDLCSFFWRILGVSFVALPLFIAVWLPLGFVIGFFGAARPRFVFWDGFATVAGSNADDTGEFCDWLFAEYSWWPSFIWDGRERVRIWPLTVLITACVLYLGLFTFWGRIVGGAFVVLFAILYFLYGTASGERYREWLREPKGATPKPNEPGLVTLGARYLKAKKRGVCPLIRIT